MEVCSRCGRVLEDSNITNDAYYEPGTYNDQELSRIAYVNPSNRDDLSLQQVPGMCPRAQRSVNGTQYLPSTQHVLASGNARHKPNMVRPRKRPIARAHTTSEGREAKQIKENTTAPVLVDICGLALDRDDSSGILHTLGDGLKSIRATWSRLVRLASNVIAKGERQQS